MKSCKSLITANKVLEKLIDDAVLKECWYHSFHSGGLEPDGFCGFIIYGKCARSAIKITFYGANKDESTPIHIFVAVDGKSRVRDKQLSIEDAIKFIVDKVAKFMPRITHTDA